jgi:hypothetical protein
MDFFTELLESFSRKHDRKLRLLEQDDEAEALAKAAFEKAKASGDNRTKALAQGPIPTPSGKPVYLWTTGKGGISFSVTQDATFPKDALKFWNELVGAFSREGAAGPEEKEKAEPQEPVMEPYQEEMTAKGIDNPELGSALKKMYDTLARRVGGARAGKTLLNTLLNDTPRLIVNEQGLYEVASSPIDQRVTEDVTNILNTLFSSEKGDLDEDFCSKIGRTNEGQVVIYPYGDDKGIVIGSKSSSRLIEKEYQVKTGCAINTVDLGANTDGSQSSIRGNLFEPVTKMISITRALAEFEESPPEDYERKKAILEKMLKEEYAILVQRMVKLDESVETWLIDSEKATYSVDDAADAQLMVDIVKGDPRLVRAIWYANSVSNELRKPLLSIRVGGDVGAGKKADNVEIFGSREAALAARDATFSKGNRPELVKRKASDIFKNNPEELRNYIATGKIESADQELYLTDISLKSIIADGPTKYGQTTPRSFIDFLRGRKPQDKFFRLFKGKMKDVFSNAESSAEFERIGKEQEEIIGSVEKLKFNASVVGADGKSLSVDALGTALDSMMEKVTLNSTFKELANNKDYKSIKALQTKYNSTKNPKAKAALESEIKKKLTTFMLKKHTQANVKGVVDDPNASDDKKRGALAFAAAMAFKTGAADNDGVVMQKNHLKRGKSYYSTQNKNFNAIIDSIKKFPDNKDGDFELAAGVGVKFVKKGKGNSGKSVNTSFDPDGNLVNTQSWSLTEDSSDIHDFAPEIQSENSSTLMQALSKLHEALGVIKEKVRIIDTH